SGALERGVQHQSPVYAGEKRDDRRAVRLHAYAPRPPMRPRPEPGGEAEVRSREARSPRSRAIARPIHHSHQAIAVVTHFARAARVPGLLAPKASQVRAPRPEAPRTRRPRRLQ